jgi:hypothetical protein
LVRFREGVALDSHVVVRGGSFVTANGHSGLKTPRSQPNDPPHFKLGMESGLPHF